MENKFLYKELKPDFGAKSFYGKAKTCEVNGWKILKSYDTHVAAISPKGEFFRLWGAWSATTARHIDTFMRVNGLHAICKADWIKLPVMHLEGV